MRDIVSAANAAATSSPSILSRDVISHHRSASDDVKQRHDDEAAWCGRTWRGGQRSVATVSRRDTMPPIHLMSATNQVRSGLVQPQQLPLKLAHSGARRPRWTSGSPANRSPVRQSDDRDRLGDVTGHSTSRRCTSTSAGLTVTSGDDRREGHSDESWTRQFHVMSPPSVGTVSTSPSASSVVERSASVMSKSSPTAAGSVLPMKLAERPRPKSASSPAMQFQSTSGVKYRQTSTMPSSTSPTDEQQSQTSSRADAEIIYF